MVLGIETSCDETAAAVVAREPDGRGRILSNVVRSQWEQHRPYGGVVPEIAARAHVECLDILIREAMAEANVTFDRLSAVAAAAGPGLIGGLMVGLTTAKAIALVHDRPLYAINHLEAHALTVGLTDHVHPPYLLLLVSGGHTQLVAIDAIGRYRRLGTTIDDALGEAFDKTAKLLGLGLPGGPNVEHWAAKGDPARFQFPRPLQGRPEPNFSFAGLKTAVRQQAMALAPLRDADIADLCAGFETAVCDTVADRCRRAFARVRESGPPHPLRLVVAGGVAANRRLRAALAALVAREGATLHVPPAALCTDNAAMIAWAALERLAAGAPPDTLDVAPRARWPLDAEAVPLIGGGRLGAKA
ncbi:MAG: tRNA (adenosine(37)-N6)-threonylcarbamoyltransferase complex transferase subunit TsaD [Hyphomicrobiaceae bacterium]